MPITIRTNELNARSGETGEFIGIDAVTDKTTEQRVAEITAASNTEQAKIQQKGAAVLDSIPDEYTELAGEVDDLKNAVDAIESKIPATASSSNKLMDTAAVNAAIGTLQPAATSSDVGKALIVKTVVDGKPSSYEYGDAGSGLNETAKALLINILKAGVYTTDQSGNIIALKNALDEGGGGGDVTITQVGTSLIFSGVSAISNVVQNGTTLVLT